MARGRTLNRHELRRQADAAEQQPAGESAAEAPEATAAPAKKAAKAKTPAVRKPRKKKEPARLCARWAVFDSSMKQLAVFDYNQRAVADQKAVELASKKPGTFFVQMVKEPMPEPAPVEE